jgi:hypothetical protein
MALHVTWEWVGTYEEKATSHLGILEIRISATRASVEKVLAVEKAPC